MGDWRRIRAGDLVSAGVLAIGDGYRMRNEELGPTGVPFVRGGDIGHGWIDHNISDHIRPEFRNRIAPKLTLPWDVAFITKGTVGRVGILRPEQPEVVFAPQVAYWRSLDHAKLCPRFIYYLLCGPEFQACLDADKTHGAMVADYVSLSQQHNFQLLLPPVTEQRAIAHILGTLDDKIELNRRMNETLEAMARALFKSWFVDFDPVRAKAQGQTPVGMDPATAALFPSEFEPSELGEIPKGWRAGSTRDLCVKVENGGTPKRSVPEYWTPATVPWLTSGEVRKRYTVTTENRISDEGLRQSSAKVWPAGTTIMAMYGATAGEVTLSAVQLSTNQACCGLIPRERYRCTV